MHNAERLLSVIFIFFDGGYCEYILSKDKGVEKQLVGWYRVLPGQLLPNSTRFILHEGSDMLKGYFLTHLK